MASINMYVEEDRSASSVLSGFPWGNLSLAAPEVMCVALLGFAVHVLT